MNFLWGGSLGVLVGGLRWGGSCLRRNDGWGAGMTEGGWRPLNRWCARGVPPPPTARLSPTAHPHFPQALLRSHKNRSPTMPRSPQHRRRALHAAGNPRCQPFRRSRASRTNLNNPEQIRTNLNIAERPDQIGTPPDQPRIPRKKHTPEHRRRPPPSFLRRQESRHNFKPPTQSFFPLPNSSLPPFRGEARWGVRRTERAAAIVRALLIHAAPQPPHARLSPAVVPAPSLSSFSRPRFRHSCAGRNEGGRRLGCWRAVGRRSWPSTPHLASPLKGGRDEFFFGGVWLGGVGWGVGVGGSCLRRNGGRGRGFLPAQE